MPYFRSPARAQWLPAIRFMCVLYFALFLACALRPTLSSVPPIPVSSHSPFDFVALRILPMLRFAFLKSTRIMSRFSSSLRPSCMTAQKHSVMTAENRSIAFFLFDWTRLPVPGSAGALWINHLGSNRFTQVYFVLGVLRTLPRAWRAGGAKCLCRRTQIRQRRSRWCLPPLLPLLRW